MKGLTCGKPAGVILPLWVGFLGFVMLLMSTNTGVIGASRVTYSMARSRIMPQWFSHIHPKFRVPTRTIVVFTLASVGFVLFVWIMGTYRLTSEDPTIILGDLYNYGALVSFMLVNLALVRLRNQAAGPLPAIQVAAGDPACPGRAGSFRVPVLPLLGFTVCLFVWILVLSLHQIGKIVGTLWFIVGIVFYLWYRRRLGLSWKEPVPGTLATDPDIAHELHPEIADQLRSRTKDREEVIIWQIPSNRELWEQWRGACSLQEHPAPGFAPRDRTESGKDRL